MRTKTFKNKDNSTMPFDFLQHIHEMGENRLQNKTKKKKIAFNLEIGFFTTGEVPKPPLLAI